MFLSRFSVQRPVAITAFTLVLIFFGVSAFSKIGVDAMPQVDTAIITIVTVDPGSTPAEIERSVAKKIEDAVVSVDGIKHLYSSCRDSVVQTFLEFYNGVNVDVVAFDVREQIDLIRSELPSTAEDPKILKFDLNAKAVVTMALTGDLPLDRLYDLADREIGDRFSVLAGVADVELLGGADLEVEVLLDRDRLAAAGLLSVDVVRAIQQGQSKIPAGRIKEGANEISLLLDGEAETVKELEQLVVKASADSRVLLGDVARVRFGHEERRQATFVNGKPAIGIRVVKKSAANAVRVVDRVEATFKRIAKEIPGGSELIWVADDRAFIQSSVDDAWGNILVGIVLTALILLVFLQDLRTTFIAAVTMPLSVLITFGLMGMLDYTFNTSTLLGLGVSVGVLVANSIVVIESILKLRARKLVAREAAIQGTTRVATAVIASAGTNVVVFIPIGMMSSTVGSFFGPFAITVAGATLVSLLLSFTISPMLGALLFKREIKENLFTRLWNRLYGPIEQVYGWSIVKIQRFPSLVVVASLAALIWTLISARGLGIDFVPEVDMGRVLVQMEFSSTQNLAHTIKRSRKVAAELQSYPGVVRRFTTVGKLEGVMGQVSEAVYLSEVTLVFADKTAREKSVLEIAGEIRTRMEAVDGCVVKVAIPSIIGGSTMPVELEISGDDLDEVERLSAMAYTKAREQANLRDVDTSVRAGRREIRIKPDRALLADIGATPAGLGATIRGNLNGILAGVYRNDRNTYDIRVKLTEKPGREQVSAFSLPGVEGVPIGLGALAKISEVEARTQILRAEKRRVGKIFANLAPGSALGTEADRLLQSLGDLPPGYGARFVGMHEGMEEANADFQEAAITAMVLVYLVLCAVLNSWLLPVMVLMTLPLALIGSLQALMLAGQNVNIFVMLAGVMLVGLVVNNAILIIEGAKQRVEEGITGRQAMVEAAENRFRPILMTSIAAVLGMLPMALGQGLGSEFRSGTGISSVGGLIVSAILSLYVIPALWFITHRK